jgi:hypothetical protein
MKTFIASIIFILFLQSCMSSRDLYTIIPEQSAVEIPIKANKIIINNAHSIYENYDNSYKIILAQDYKIEKDNKEQGYVLAYKKAEGDTYVRLNISCSEGVIYVTSEWKAGSESEIFAQALSGLIVESEWENAQWNKSGDKSSVAFANAVKFAQLIPGAISYITP